MSRIDKFYPKRKAKKEKIKLLQKWDSYNEYLCSELWHNLRNTKIREVGGRCQVCYSDKELNVHHRTYKRIFHEKLSDLTVLCRECHALYHNKVDQGLSEST